MAKKDYSTQDLPTSKTKKIKVTKKDIAESMGEKIKKISSPFDMNSIKKERAQQIKIGRKFFEHAGLSNEELIFVCASLKADLDIANKRIKAFKEMNSVILEAGIDIETHQHEKIDYLLRKERKKSSK